MYMAQIAAQAGNAMNGKPVKVQDYVLKFRARGTRTTAAESKACWQAQTGKRAK